MRYLAKKYRSFTLLEVILVIAILVISTSAGMWFTKSSLNQSQIVSTAETITSLIRRTQTRAGTNENNQVQGVTIKETELVFFKGPSEALSTETETFELPQGIVIDTMVIEGGGNEVVFTAFTGETLTPGSFRLNVSGSETTLTISISSLGLIQWQS